MISAEAFPHDHDLDELFSQATRLELRAMITLDKLIAPGPILWEISGPQVLEFRQIFRVTTPDEPAHCMTWGDHVLQCHGADGLLDTLELLSLSSVRWTGRWNSDAELADGGLGLAQWLERSGDPEPLRQFHLRQEAMVLEAERQAMDKIHFESWLKTRPSCLSGPENTIEQLEALRIAYGDHTAGARALLEWLGRAQGLSQERSKLPLTLLAAFPIETIVAALEGADRTGLRGGWSYLGGNNLLQYIPRHLREAMRESHG